MPIYKFNEYLVKTLECIESNRDIIDVVRNYFTPLRIVQNKKQLLYPTLTINQLANPDQNTKKSALPKSQINTVFL